MASCGTLLEFAERAAQRALERVPIERDLNRAGLRLEPEGVAYHGHREVVPRVLVEERGRAGEQRLGSGLGLGCGLVADPRLHVLHRQLDVVGQRRERGGGPLEIEL